MYDYLKGELVYKHMDYIVVEVGHIGYKVMTSQFTASQLKQGETVTVYTELIVREDYMGLCGFSDREELKVYQLLTSISGIGPKVGLAMLSNMPYAELTRCILTGDVKTLQKAPGIGAKTAQRIVLELKDKLSKSLQNIPLPLELAMQASEKSKWEDNLKDAMEAMVQLGYKASDVEKIFAAIEEPNATVEELIKQALRMIAF